MKNNSLKLNLITICKDDINAYKKTLSSLLCIKNNICLISIIRCSINLRNTYKEEFDKFPIGSISFNIDNSLYNALNIASTKVYPGIPLLTLHAGDILIPGTDSLLIRKSDILKKKKMKIIAFKTKLYNYNNIKNNEILSYLKLNLNRLKQREPDNRFLYLIYNRFYYPCHQSCLYSSDLITEKWNENLGNLGDIEYYHRILKKCKSIEYMDTAITAFNTNGISSRATNSKIFLSRLFIIRYNKSILLDIRFLKGFIFSFFKVIFNYKKKRLFN